MNKFIITALLTLVAITGLAQEKKQKLTVSYRFSQKPKKENK